MFVDLSLKLRWLLVFIPLWCAQALAEIVACRLARGVALDRDGSVYVTDALNSRVQKFSITTRATSITWTELKTLWR